MLEVARRSVPGPRPGKKHDGGCDDALLLAPDRGLLGIADGLGQYRGGGVASALALTQVEAEPDGESDDVRAWLGRVVQRAARAVHARGRAEPGLGSMSTTLTIARIAGAALHIAHVGDSRCYVLRAGALEQLTRDHSLAWEQVEAGALTKAQARAHPNQRLLTRTLIARRDAVVPDLSRHDLAAGDLLLLCTDGVTKALDDAAIAAALAVGGACEALADRLLAAVDAAGRVDDTSLILARP